MIFSQCNTILLYSNIIKKILHSTRYCNFQIIIAHFCFYFLRPWKIGCTSWHSLCLLVMLIWRYSTKLLTLLYDLFRQPRMLELMGLPFIQKKTLRPLTSTQKTWIYCPSHPFRWLYDPFHPSRRREFVSPPIHLEDDFTTLSIHWEDLTYRAFIHPEDDFTSNPSN